MDDKPILIAIGMFGILLILCFSLLFITPIYKAKHYTRLTGIEVTYMDALLLDLDPSKHVILLEQEKGESK